MNLKVGTDIIADLTAKTRDLIQRHLGLKAESVILGNFPFELGVGETLVESAKKQIRKLT